MGCGDRRKMTSYFSGYREFIVYDNDQAMTIFVLYCKDKRIFGEYMVQPGAVGLSLRNSQGNCFNTVDSVEKNSQASDLGIQIGWQLIKLDGEDWHGSGPDLAKFELLGKGDKVYSMTFDKMQ